MLKISLKAFSENPFAPEENIFLIVANVNYDDTLYRP